MGSELSTAIAMCTAWADDDITQWTQLAQTGIAQDPLDMAGQLTHVAVRLAVALAAQAGGDATVSTVLQHLAIDAETDEGEPPD